MISTTLHLPLHAPSTHPSSLCVSVSLHPPHSLSLCVSFSLSPCLSPAPLVHFHVVVGGSGRVVHVTLRRFVRGHQPGHAHHGHALHGHQGGLHPWRRAHTWRVAAHERACRGHAREGRGPRVGRGRARGVPGGTEWLLVVLYVEEVAGEAALAQRVRSLVQLV